MKEELALFFLKLIENSLSVSKEIMNRVLLFSFLDLYLTKSVRWMW